MIKLFNNTQEDIFLVEIGTLIEVGDFIDVQDYRLKDVSNIKDLITNRTVIGMIDSNILEPIVLLKIIDGSYIADVYNNTQTINNNILQFDAGFPKNKTTSGSMKIDFGGV